MLPWTRHPGTTKREVAMSEIPGEGVVSLGTGFSVRSTPASVERTESAFPSRATSPAPTGGVHLFPDKLRVRWAHERLVSGMTQCRSVYPSSPPGGATRQVSRHAPV